MEGKDMHFDLVIGNPPYNKGMDIDFIDLGYELSEQYTVMIVPAKWQAADANQRISSRMSYGQFREKLVPHMEYVCFYPDCLDVFGIQEQSGVSWFILDKSNTYENRNTVAIRKEQIAQANSTGTVSKLRLPSYIPDLTNRQIYKLVESGWSTELISKISGLGEQEIQKKYRQYICK